MLVQGSASAVPRRVMVPRLLDEPESHRLLDSAIEKGRPAASAIEFDFSQLEFCKPSGMVVFACLLRWLKTKSVQIKLTIPPSKDRTSRFAQTEPLKYLDDSEFFKQWTGSNIYPWSKVRPTTIPLKSIRSGETHSWIEFEFMPWIVGHSSLDETAFDEIIVSLREIFNNISDHSGISEGYAFAQVYPEKKSLVISIADFGLGIPANVRKVRPNLDDGQAILVASQEGFTTSSTGRNLGLGLDTLIKYTLETNGGVVRIRSGQGRLICAHGSRGAVRTPLPARGQYPGTLVEFAFRLDKLEARSEMPSTLPWR